MPKLTDPQFAEIERRLNNAVHELVFTIKHCEDDQLDDASNCLMTVSSVINEVADEIVIASES